MKNLPLNQIIQGDCLEVLSSFPANSIDAIVTDPPYGLSFMGKHWDYDVPKTEIWKEALRVLKPGGYLLSFAGTRTQHRMALNIEDAGFEIRDMIAWVYASGFPKSLNIGKAVDKLNGRNTELYNEIGLYIKEQRNKKGYTLDDINKFCGRVSIAALWESQKIKWVRLPTMKDWIILKEKLELDDRFDYVIAREENEREKVGKKEVGYVSQEGAFNEKSCGFKKGTIDITKGNSEWEGWGTALKPALEPITVARKPLEGTVAENCLKWGVGGINIDGCRVETNEDQRRPSAGGENGLTGTSTFKIRERKVEDQIQHAGRFPANLIHDGSDEVVSLFPNSKSGSVKGVYGHREGFAKGEIYQEYKASEGSASRFFYCAKASKSERNMGCEGLEENKTLYNQTGLKNNGDGTERPVGGMKNSHPTVKPIALMEYLIKLISREGQTILDPFAGSCSTAVAAKKLKRNFIMIEREAEYLKICEARIAGIKEKVGLFNYPK